ncbi:MAG: hypothetical protein Q9N34_02970 [Aquificota bacterium]|nr:hypothetical protein [Aquificota bacterium]
MVKLRISGFEPITRSFYLIRDPNRPISTGSPGTVGVSKAKS